MMSSQRKRPAHEVIAGGHVHVLRCPQRLPSCGVVTEKTPCPMTFVPVTSLQRQSHLDDAISNSKASFDIIAMGKIFSPCVFAAEKVPLSCDVIITDKAIFLGHTAGENASLIVYSLDIRPAFHNIVTGTLPPSCDAITREGALPYDVIRGTVPLPVMSSPEMTTHSGTSPGGDHFCDATCSETGRGDATVL
ncbi:uncharacterized protein LOC103790092 [Callithrix jacchus]|uniref:uncharacterized protein LOC103790092 n=1 Tax=Callithrix jacchus TaxID=9483 RepID=UPI0023DD49E8|nr:uncharacterized protein LOC103790092 [Callithrix jacchus]